LGTGQWRRLEDTDYTHIRVERERRDFKSVGREMVRDAVWYVAEAQRFDSAQDWIRSLPAWDGVPRIEQFYVSYMGAQDSTYIKGCGLYTWTALAGRIMSPGCQADMAPILVSAQGTGKTRGVAAIAPAPEFFDSLDLAAPAAEITRRIRGRLVLEMGELKGLRIRDVTHIKSFITERKQTSRRLYQETEYSYRRRCIFFGTTNEVHFLTDETGNRRFLPIVITQVDVAAIERDRVQLWAEGLARFQAEGVVWREAQEGVQLVNADHEVPSAIRDAVEEWLANDVDLDGTPVTGRRVVTLKQACQASLGGVTSPSRQQERDVKAAMEQLGHRYGVHKAGKDVVQRGFLVVT